MKPDLCFLYFASLAGSLIPISLDPAADVIQIFPTPYHDDVSGIRIEVNGQVLGLGLGEASAGRRQTNNVHKDDVVDIARYCSFMILR